jgi:hypothetical protein
LITLIMLGEEYKLWSSSLCSFLHPPVTSSLYGPNILLNTLLINTQYFYYIVIAKVLLLFLMYFCWLIIYRNLQRKILTYYTFY